MDPEGAPASRGGWERWRKTMLAGALVLLAGALAEALMEPDPPEAVKLAAQFVGFGCLAVGFALKMRSR